MGVFSPGGSAPSSGIVTVVGVGTPVVTNLTIAAANTEQSIVLPSTTKRYLLKVEEAKLQVAFTLAGSGTTYVTVPRYGLYSEDELTLTGPLTLYIQSALAGLRVEVLSWS